MNLPGIATIETLLTAIAGVMILNLSFFSLVCLSLDVAWDNYRTPFLRIYIHIKQEQGGGEAEKETIDKFVRTWLNVEFSGTFHATLLHKTKVASLQLCV